MIRTALIGLAALLAPLTAQHEATLAEGTRFETSYITVDSGRSGPTVLLLGGVHGNEPAGARAARQIAGWTLARGKLVVVPRANVLALEAGKRRTPGLPKDESDLNRQFPRRKGERPRGELATALWELTRRTQPDLVVDLHEGYDFTRINPKSVGSSVIASDDAREHAQRMIAALDPTIENSKKRFKLKGPPIETSLARAAHEVLGIPSMICETTTKDQQLTLRVRQHRILVHRLLADLEMVAHGPHVFVGAAADDDDVRVGMYVSVGVGGPGPRRLEEILDREHDFVVRRLCGADVRSQGVLDQFDVVIFPGGSASKQASTLEHAGRAAVRSYVRQGGGYVGFCAGAYLAANNYDWGLGILDADVVDRAHWARGKGQVAIEWHDGETGNVRYANGPLYARSEDPALPDFEVLATYRGEIRKSEKIPKGVMEDTPAVVAAAYGDGRVVCSSPHPEQTTGLEDAVRGLVRRAAQR